MACAHLYTDYRDFDAVYVRALCECVCRQCDVINRSLSILQIHRIRQRDARYSTLIVHICVRQIYRIVSTKWIRRNRRKENFMKTNLVCRGNEQKEHNNEMIEDEVCSSEQIRRNTIRRTRNEECEMNVYVPKDKSIKLFCLHVNVRSTYSGCSCCSERSCYNRWMDIVDWRCMIELSWLLCGCIKLTKVFRHQLLHSQRQLECSKSNFVCRSRTRRATRHTDAAWTPRLRPKAIALMRPIYLLSSFSCFDLITLADIRLIN